VAEERDRLIAKQRKPVLGDASELAMCNVVSHDSLVLMCLRGLIEPHAEAEAHAVQDLLDLVQRLAAEVLRS
jgi:hypothetical protein